MTPEFLQAQKDAPIPIAMRNSGKYTIIFYVESSLDKYFEGYSYTVQKLARFDKAEAPEHLSVAYCGNSEDVAIATYNDA